MPVRRVRAQAEWNPGKQALVCSFCGTTTPFTIDEAGTIHELDLAPRCASCRTNSGDGCGETVGPVSELQGGLGVRSERVGQNCDFCGSPLVPYDEIKAPIRPESLLPFKVTEAEFGSRFAAGMRASGSRRTS